MSEQGIVLPRPTPESFALLAAFRAISANAVYTMAPKASVLKGYNYYQEQRLQHFVWSQDRTTLTAQVEGTRLYEVVFSIVDGFLSASCDCPAWDPGWLCKHVLCAYFTTKHVFHRSYSDCREGITVSCLGSRPNCSATSRSQSERSSRLSPEQPARNRPMRSSLIPAICLRSF